MQSYKLSNGFTLLELLAVLVILAALATIALPIFRNKSETAKQIAHNENVRILQNQAQAYLLSLSSITDDIDCIPEMVAAGYLKEVPTNPLTSGTQMGAYAVVVSAATGRATVNKQMVEVTGLASGGGEVVYNGTHNVPKLLTGMIAKKWNGSNWDTITDPVADTSWYNYATKQWANAQTADGSMWVWIPRYEYQIPTPHTNAAQTILVNFINGTSTAATGGYTVHPAFTIGGTELTGIWVAKFEASGTIDAVDIKPGVVSLRSTTIDAMFTACRNMEINSRYGWGTTGAGIDTHLMKNIEWGAVAYLTQSSYGKNCEVWINNSSSYITGSAGSSASAGSDVGTTNDYKSAQGINASTTGNVYGVYDMSGGSWEYVAAYINNNHDNITTYGNSLKTSYLADGNKYIDIYNQGASDTEENNYAAASSKKGDATYETSFTYGGSNAWYGDYQYYPNNSDPFFARGGNYDRTSYAGVFAGSNSSGATANYSSFRPCLVALP